MFVAFVQDFDSHISSDGKSYKCTNGNDALYLDYYNGLVASAGYTDYPNPDLLSDIGPLIINFVALARSSLKDDPTGVDYALYWCFSDWFDTSNTNYIDMESAHNLTGSDTSTA